MLSIPLQRLAEYPGVDAIVRVDKAEALLELIDSPAIERVAAVELRSLPEQIEDFAERLSASPFPIDLVLEDPAADAHMLYRLARLGDDRPIRSSMFVRPGIGTAVSLATSLGIGVFLRAGQPDEPLVDELAEVVKHYLTGADVDVPIEFPHSVLAVLLGEEPLTLWQICEDDPGFHHVVTDEGKLLPSSRCVSGMPDEPPERMLDALAAELQGCGAECCTCRYQDICAGYFKVPDRDYSCEHVKRVFGMLEDASAELMKDMRIYDGGDP